MTMRSIKNWASVNWKKLGFHVTQAWNGTQALTELSKQPFNVVLMDCQMPELDGYEATRQLRSREDVSLNSDVVVIAMTANALAGDRDRCIAAGMTTTYRSRSI